jgi:hypothetical protein
VTVVDAPVTVGLVDDGVRGGWRLHVECFVCGAEDMFDGVVMGLAIHRAEKAGWGIDREAVYSPITERADTCPRHHTPR